MWAGHLGRGELWWNASFLLVSMLVFETVLEFLGEIEVCYLSVVAKNGVGSLPWLLITVILPQSKWMC